MTIAERMAVDASEPMLTISIVVFRPDPATIRATLASLAHALLPVGPQRAKLFIIDNSPEEDERDWLRVIPPQLAFEVISGHGNIGYGRANNLVIDRLGHYHLVLNPDVVMEPEALSNALAFISGYPECGLITPAAFYPDGRRQYLCKRYPSLLDLLLRGFAPPVVRRLFHRRLNRYEMRDRIGDEVVWDPPVVSGCFMLFRSEVFRELGGFDKRYRLYFEDFDISLRAGRITRIAYVPTVRIVHSGGVTARKGLWHIREFIRSAGIFFSVHAHKFY
ncbi:hypothetical protein L598_005800000110 [Mesorhizobium sp. J18]|uniref:glycosyltransferase family 2 protein n=1 Tax=Mesorhizobium sp. J18 TaxID=935263 RepID=UPI00119C4A8F|nr:glycosyltransferase family 2 protein [Mesorhizobium sp. J18]TWG91598.1 hypothetical protein L598_005800000110 [Mesorhizobium sp. J18]